ncbi:formate dehydrogenase accessory protein FdhE [Bordetella sp. N]|uniref:formate dehydrogenase accessory protein FdhE n=1 Tax=Bordetella sp. N TaxID=1746199 RepID=UPI00070E2BAC|nr:formate dehydrogenase accessory protein FdhE [Bordetella sp. N]ALM85155.1 formate dehydrogenase accessory protein FdhE [Bordetella sp. N]
MQRILPRGEIEALDHNHIPRLLAPVRGEVFRLRAARLRELAPGNAIGDYLSLIAVLADAQHIALAQCETPAVDAQRIALAQAHGMAPVAAGEIPRDPAWHQILLHILDHLDAAAGLPAPVRAICADLRLSVQDDAEGLDRAAAALVGEGAGQIDVATAPFLMAALQVYATDQACRFDSAQLPVVSPYGLCPVCGSLPVASVVRVGGQQEGYRYLCCALCSTQWHVVRVKCTTCEETRNIAYQGIETEDRALEREAARAETCESCHTYRKIFSQDKAFNVDPIADDLATLALDLLVGEAGYQRASGNPFLWQGEDEETATPESGPEQGAAGIGRE